MSVVVARTLRLSRRPGAPYARPDPNEDDNARTSQRRHTRYVSGLIPPLPPLPLIEIDGPSNSPASSSTVSSSRSSPSRVPPPMRSQDAAIAEMFRSRPDNYRTSPRVVSHTSAESLLDVIHNAPIHFISPATLSTAHGLSPRTRTAVIQAQIGDWSPLPPSSLPVSTSRAALKARLKKEQDECKLKDEVAPDSQVWSRCHVCLHNKRKVVSKPCSHSAGCFQCAYRFLECNSTPLICSICRAEITNMLIALMDV